jgi:hypothetical protein
VIDNGYRSDAAATVRRYTVTVPSADSMPISFILRFPALTVLGLFRVLFLWWRLRCRGLLVFYFLVGGFALLL